MSAPAQSGQRNRADHPGRDRGGPTQAGHLPGLGTRADSERRPDHVTILGLYAALLLLLPSRYVLGSIGAAGAPGELLGVAVLIVLAGYQIGHPVIRGRSRAIDSALTLFAAAILASYVAAASRVIDGAELRSADRGMLDLASWVGVALLASVAIPSRKRLDSLLKWIVLVGAGVAVMALLQFGLGWDATRYLRLPGLTENGTLLSVGGRAGFRRPAGTAISPIELGVVLAMLLPLALHYAFHDRQRSAFRRWLPVVLIAFTLPLTVSRSAILGLAVVLLVLVPTWTTSQRRRSYGFIAAGLGAVYVLVPGLLGSLSSLFLNIASDSSTLSRTDSYSLAGHYISQTPLFGRGFGTFLPSYRILDNEYLLITIEAGVLGAVACVSLLVTGIRRARAARRRAFSAEDRSLCQSLVASIAVAVVGFGTFDSLEFKMFAGVFFLILGCVGAADRLVSGGFDDAR